MSIKSEVIIKWFPYNNCDIFYDVVKNKESKSLKKIYPQNFIKVKSESQSNMQKL